MRILDLGAHDGFVSAYVIDCARANEADVELHIDGIELNEHGVSEFNRRMVERQCPGHCKMGRAEDAPNLFEPGSYDAVVAFELIEHVPDVEDFLHACEVMLKPNGRVYLSTPNGTFGEGQNPHHLRVYRAVDLAELCRRRGDVQDVQVGVDTITVLSYTPWRACQPPLRHGRGEVAIYTGQGWQQWSPRMIEMPGGLGGSETAAARLADSLTALGFTVTVYGEVEAGCYGQVVYRHHSTFDPLVPRKAVILSRAPWMAQRPIMADKVLLWMHDTDYGPSVTEAMTRRIDKVMVLSEWHRKHVAITYPFLDGKLAVTANGIHADYFVDPTQPPPDRDPARVIYSSSPDRGLDFLLELWPRVVEQVPEAELVYCYADVYKAVAEQRPEVAAFAAKVAHLAKQPNVINIGGLAQQDLAVAMRSCGVWVAPSWTSWADVPFMETFCIGAVEAAAAGCHLVMSEWGALIERARTAVSWQLVPGTPLTGTLDPDLWVQAIVGGIQAARAGVRQSDDALRCSWDRVALDFAREFGDEPTTEEFQAIAADEPHSFPALNDELIEGVFHRPQEAS